MQAQPSSAEGLSGSTNVVVVGAPCMDVIFDSCSAWPTPEHSIACKQIKMSPGGKALNQVVAAARLGAITSLVGCIGDDAWGHQLLSILQMEGVDTSQITVNPSTGTAVIGVILHNQMPGFLASQGASVLLSQDDAARSVERCCQGIFPNCVVVVTFEVPPSVVLASLQAARRCRAHTILNPGPMLDGHPPELDMDVLLPLVDLLVPNYLEAQLLLGLPDATPEKLAEEFMRRGVKAVCITLGTLGALFCTSNVPGQYWRQPIFPVAAVDTTGASDALVGALAVGCTQEWQPERLIHFAAAAAAVACTKSGAMPSMPRMDDVVNLMQSNDHCLQCCIQCTAVQP
eukprot:GGOE01019433.1.p1 GENE.GGOE01019433.1~~GGOE01019433.1.p1  ORF type:complete len:364 (-),score=28.01 GGOE01019433.1:43-1074(-)